MFKPRNKSKRKNSDMKRWWLLAGGFVLLTLVVGGAAAFAVLQSRMAPTPPSTAVPNYPTSSTQTALLCDTEATSYGLITRYTDNYTTWLYQDTDTDYMETRTSPDRRFSVRETVEGLILRDNRTDKFRTLIQRQMTRAIGSSAIFSPDSRYLAYVDENTYTLILIDLVQMHPYVIQDAKVLANYHNDDNFLRWSPDSRWLLLIGTSAAQLVNPEIRQVIQLDEPSYEFSSKDSWSEGGRYLVIESEIFDTQTGHVLANIPFPVGAPVFSPDEQFVAYITHDQTLTVQSVTNPQLIARTLIAGTASVHGLIWSPKSRYLLISLIYDGAVTEEARVFTPPTEISRDGLIPALNEVATRYVYLGTPEDAFVPLSEQLSPAQQRARYWSPDGWSEEGETLHLQAFSKPGNEASVFIKATPLRNPPDGESNLAIPAAFVAYANPIQHDPMLVFSDDNEGFIAYLSLHNYVFFKSDITHLYDVQLSPDGTTFFVRGVDKTVERAELFDLTSGNITRLAENATDMGDPAWSPDGRRVALVYAQGIGADRRVKLVIAARDGSGSVTLDDDFLSVYDVVWSDDGQQVACTIWREDGTHIELADTHTGARQRLLTNALTTDRLAYDGWRGVFTAWWQDQDKLTVWHGGFTPDGTPAFLLQGRYKYRPFDGVWKLPAGGSIVNGLQTSQVFWSPDGTAAVLRFGIPAIPQTIQLAYPDGRTPLVLDDRLDGYLEPEWSPDSRYILYGMKYRNTVQEYNVSSHDGQALAQMFTTTTYRWVGCPDVPQK